MSLCEQGHRNQAGLHLCARSAGHAGEHRCALVDLCGVRWPGREALVAWAAATAVRAEHLGPCAECTQVVRAGQECSECLEEDGAAVHEECCQLEEER